MEKAYQKLSSIADQILGTDASAKASQRTQRAIGLGVRMGEETSSNIRAATDGLERSSRQTEAEPKYDVERSMAEWIASIRENTQGPLTPKDENLTTETEGYMASVNFEGKEFNTENVGKMLMDDLQEALGITPEQAAGFVGNLDYETGSFKFMQELEPVVKGSRGGLGFAQWTGPRRVAFERWAAENELDPRSYEANFGYLVHEIQNTPEGKFFDNLMEAKTAEQAARIVSEQYLRPGKPNLTERIFRAQKYFEGAEG